MGKAWYDDYFYDCETKELTKEGFYLREFKKDYVLYFKTEEDRSSFINQEESLYDFKCMVFKI